MPIQPKLVSDRLVDDINALAVKGEIPKFALKRFRSDAERIKSSDASGAYMVLGMLDCLEWDAENMRANHERALRLLSSDVNMHVNYCTSLKRMLFVSDAHNVAASSQKRWPDDPGLADLCVRTATYAGKVSSAIGYEIVWEKLNPGKRHPYSTFLHAARKILHAHDVSDDRFTELAELVGFALRSRRVAALSNSFYATEEDGGLVDIEILIDMDPDSIADLNVSIAEHVAANLDGEWPSVIAFSLAPSEGVEIENGSEPQGFSTVG